jgi:hypothetical protein
MVMSVNDDLMTLCNESYNGSRTTEERTILV